MEEKVDLISSALLKERTKPVSLFWGYVDVEDYNLYKTDNNAVMNMHSRNKERLAAYLRSFGYPAFSDKDPRVKNPGVIMITDSGIQTPFMEPEVAEKFARKMQKIINNSGFVRVFGHLNAVEHEQLTVPQLVKSECDMFLDDIELQEKLLQKAKERGHPIQSKEEFEELLCKFKHILHPDHRMRETIFKKFGPCFLEKMWREAEANARDLSQIIEETKTERNGFLYSGRSVGCDKYTVHSRNNLESRSGVYATTSLGEAMRYAKKFGFVYIYEDSKNQRFHNDFGWERGEKPVDKPDAKSETQICPEENKCMGTYLYVGDNKFFKIPEHIDRWQAFLEYFRSSLITDNENVYQRRLNMLKNVDENGRAVTYMPIGGKIEDIEVPQDEKFEDMELYLASLPTEIRKTHFEELYGLNMYEKKENHKMIVPQLKEIYDKNKIPDFSKPNIENITAMREKIFKMKKRENVKKIYDKTTGRKNYRK